MKINRVKVPMVDINYEAMVNGENPIAKVEKISWKQLRGRMIDKELVRKHIKDLELSIPTLEKRIKELRKELKEQKRKLRDEKILFWQAGGEE